MRVGGPRSRGKIHATFSMRSLFRPVLCTVALVTLSTSSLHSQAKEAADIGGTGESRRGGRESREAVALRRRPNLLFLLTDNQPWHAMGCAGNRIIRTPNMDRLARDGVRFTRAFTTTPICGASRASILTGLYRRRHGFTFHTAPLRKSLTRQSYPALLKQVGYHTGFIGKFGIESDHQLRIEDEEQSLAEMFDHFDNFEHWGPDGYFVKQADGSKKHLTEVTADKALEFLDRWRDLRREAPFCLSVSFNAPHAQDNAPQQYFWPASVDRLYSDAKIPVPETAAPSFFDSQPLFLRTSLNRERWRWRFDTAEKFQRMNRGMYRMVSGVDEAIGRVLTKVGALGMSGETVVVFASDNGMFFGERGLSDCWLLYEDSIRVPLIVLDPRAASSRRGATSKHLVLNIDIAPTLLEIAGAPAPASLQGRSLVPLIEGRKVEWRTDFLCEHLFEHEKIPRSDGVRSNRWKYIRYFDQSPVHEELYDLERDPLETRNLARDPDHRETLEQLRVRRRQLVDLVLERKSPPSRSSDG